MNIYTMILGVLVVVLIVLNIYQYLVRRGVLRIADYEPQRPREGQRGAFR